LEINERRVWNPKQVTSSNPFNLKSDEFMVYSSKSIFFLPNILEILFSKEKIYGKEK